MEMLTILHRFKFFMKAVVVLFLSLTLLRSYQEGLDSYLKALSRWFSFSLAVGFWIIWPLSRLYDSWRFLAGQKMSSLAKDIFLLGGLEIIGISSLGAICAFVLPKLFGVQSLQDYLGGRGNFSILVIPVFLIASVFFYLVLAVLMLIVFKVLNQGKSYEEI